MKASFACVFFLLFCGVAKSQEQIEGPFDKQKWLVDYNYRFYVSKKEEFYTALEGISKAEILERLGKPNLTTQENEDSFTYCLAEKMISWMDESGKERCCRCNGTFIVLYFVNAKVQDMIRVIVD